MIKAKAKIRKQLAYIETEHGQKAIIPKDAINTLQQKYKIQITKTIKTPNTKQ